MPRKLGLWFAPPPLLTPHTTTTHQKHFFFFFFFFLFFFFFFFLMQGNFDTFALQNKTVSSGNRITYSRPSPMPRMLGISFAHHPTRPSGRRVSVSMLSTRPLCSILPAVATVCHLCDPEPHNPAAEQDPPSPTILSPRACLLLYAPPTRTLLRGM
jgi:hypothetical protein